MYSKEMCIVIAGICKSLSFHRVNATWLFVLSFAWTTALLCTCSSLLPGQHDAWVPGNPFHRLRVWSLCKLRCVQEMMIELLRASVKVTVSFSTGMFPHTVREMSSVHPCLCVHWIPKDVLTEGPSFCMHRMHAGVVLATCVDIL